MTQLIRSSQFVLSYGPGAIIEGKDGPRIIPDADIGLFVHGGSFHLDDYRIDDERMSSGLLDGAKIFRLPSNAESGRLRTEYLYRTRPFPNWKLCLNQDRHQNRAYLLYSAATCPICKLGMSGQQEAIRFVQACPDGHLDEVSWNYIVHKGKLCTMAGTSGIRAELTEEGSSFLWNRRGGTLAAIEIECPRCGEHESLGNAYYNRNLRCSGRSPEREDLKATPSRPRCTRHAKIIQRQSSILRIPEVRTLLSIRGTYTQKHILFQNSSIQSGIAVAGMPESYDSLEKMLCRLRDANQIKQNLIDDLLLGSDWEELKQIMHESRNSIPESYHGLILDEFEELNRASVYGAPPQQSGGIPSDTTFEVNPHFIRDVTSNGKICFRITPIQKLRTVTVQTGYRREISHDDDEEVPRRVKTDIIDSSGNTWYPGVQFLGEGLYITFKDENKLPNITGSASKKWFDALSKGDDYPDNVFRDPAQSHDELHPGFVWLHTLAHLLVRSMGEEAGYSAASIRERIYFSNDKTPKGGILLYATQPGSEGTMGGLVALASHFEDLLEKVEEQIEACSGDPLCSDGGPDDRKYIGASCYGCTMNSETSCEHRNMWLDRNVLLDNTP